MTHQPLPSGSTEADRYARVLALLRGPEISPGDGTQVAEDLRVLGGMLADAQALALGAVAQAHPGTATDLLGDLESEYGLPDGAGLPVALRQARLLAKARARRAGDAPSLLFTARTLAAEALIALNPYDRVGGTDPMAVHRFALLLSDAHWSDGAVIAALHALLGQQAPAHVGWTIGVSLRFRCDDPDSRVERDLLSF